MPFYPLTLGMSDAYGRTTTRSFKVEAADFATAQGVVTAFIPDYQAATQLQVYKSELTDKQLYAGAPQGGANKDEGMTISCELASEPGKKASLQVPGPVDAIRNVDGTIDIANAIMTALEANFTGGGVTISDGEEVNTFIKGTLDV